MSQASSVQQQQQQQSGSRTAAVQQQQQHQQQQQQQQPGGGAQAATAGGDGGGGQPAPAPQGRKPNVALTVVSGNLHQNWTSVFVRSWRRHSPDTRLVVFVDEVAAAGQAVLREFGAELVPFELPPGAQVVAHRFRLWLDWLRVHGEGVGGVALTDARDVYLQSDPWQDSAVQALLAQDAVLFTLEGGRAIGDLRIGQQAQNIKWTSKCFPPEVYGELEGKPISCAGVTLGSASAVRAYIEAWFRALYHDALPACKSITGGACPARLASCGLRSRAVRRGASAAAAAAAPCRCGGAPPPAAPQGHCPSPPTLPPPLADQAVHNYLLHYLGPRGRLGFNYRALSNWESPVATATYGWPMRVDAYGRLHRPNATFPSIVHQYDRSCERGAGTNGGVSAARWRPLFRVGGGGARVRRRSC